MKNVSDEAENQYFEKFITDWRAPVKYVLVN